jgi:hypothetical protein
LRDQNIIRRGVFDWTWIRQQDFKVRCRAQAAQLQVALALFQTKENRPAQSLNELVPKYLKHLPVDPLTGKSFRYRVSKGEEINARANLPPLGPLDSFKIAPGQGVIWSPGADGHFEHGGRKIVIKDEDGKQTAYEGVVPAEDRDLFFLVPYWGEVGDQ